MKLKTTLLSLLLLGCVACERPSNDLVLMGRHQELYQQMYIHDITGEKLLEEYASVEEAQADARTKVEATCALIDSLHRHGKEFLFIFVPTKTAVYPEYLPREIRRQTSDFSLEEYYIQLFQEYNIPHIDFYHYFQTLKKTYPYPLFARTGSHWAQCTMPVVADSILRMMEAITDFRLPTLVTADLNITTDYTAQDAELEMILDSNPPPRKPLPRPIGALRDTAGKDRPNLLVVGDGNFTQIRKSGFIEAFNECDFWIYNDILCSTRPGYAYLKLDDCPIAYEMLEEADIVMGIMTAPYFYQYFFGFEQTAYRLWREGPIGQEKAIAMKIKEIANNKEWYDLVVKQAREKGIPVEENLRKNALFMLNAPNNPK